MNSAEVKKFIRENESLFWYIKKDKLEDISPTVLVEFILNFGSSAAVKKLIELFGIDTVAEIFYNNSKPWKANQLFTAYGSFF